MKILTVLGARPQFIKAATVSRAFSMLNGDVEEVIVHTGQHYDVQMSSIFFSEMEIPEPRYNLHIHGGGHGSMTGRMMECLEPLLLEEKPDVVLVYGDTNSTLAGALCAKKLGVPVCHVEAGLRSYNMNMPEEINRILTDRLSDVLFCPTQNAVRNLLEEGFNHFPAVVIFSGDVMLDAALFYGNKSAQNSTIGNRFNLDSRYILATLHRAENTDDLKRLISIIEALNQIHTICPIVAPIHPRTRGALIKNSIVVDFTCLEPVGYFDMVELIKHSQLVMTDSGGLQKEAFFFDKHCVVLRDETEWKELTEAGINRLSGVDPEKILADVTFFLENRQVIGQTNFYGEGQAAEKIALYLHELYGK